MVASGQFAFSLADSDDAYNRLKQGRPVGIVYPDQGAEEAGCMIIPPMAFKNCLSECAKFLSIQIPGAGKATYTKHFEAGVLVTDGLTLPIKKDKVEGLWLFVPADGRRGSGKRVEKCFPVVQHWEGEVVYYVLDETITKDVFRKHLEEAGKFIGIGFFRPRNNGFFGRFQVVDVQWPDEESA
jgi:hypothetical protein